MRQYEFDAVRFLTGRAKAARVVKNFADEDNFIQCAKRIKELEEEVQPRVRRSEREARLEEALREIISIEFEEFGGDWDEIEEAQEIARRALEEK